MYPLNQVLALIIMGSWLSLSLFIDFWAISSIIFTTSDIHEGGDMVLRLIKGFNIVELGLALLLIILFLAGPKSKLQGLIRLGLLIITCVLSFHLRPEIDHYAQEMKRHRVDNTATMPTDHPLSDKKDNLYDLAFDSQQKAHSYYIKLDSAKILILLFVFCLTFRRPRRQKDF